MDLSIISSIVSLLCLIVTLITWKQNSAATKEIAAQILYKLGEASANDEAMDNATFDTALKERTALDNIMVAATAQALSRK